MKFSTTPRKLGALTLSSFCPRCCWYLERLKTPPFKSPMPAIMFQMEDAEKAVLRAYLLKHKAWPGSLKVFGDCVANVEFPFEFRSELEKYDVLLKGRADEVVQRRDGLLCLVDLKTAMFKGDDDPFLSQYEIQVIGYSYLAELDGLGKMGSTGIIYCENQLNAVEEAPLDHLSKSEHLMMPFAFKPHPVELNYDRLWPLLEQMIDIHESNSPPQGKEKCKDCNLVRRLLDLEAGLLQQDRQTFQINPYLRNRMIQHEYWRRQSRVPPDNSDNVDDFKFQEDGMWADWDD